MALVLEILNRLLIKSLVKLYILLLEVVVLIHQAFVVLLVWVQTIALDSGLKKLVFICQLDLLLKQLIKLFLKFPKVITDVD